MWWFGSCIGPNWKCLYNTQTIKKTTENIECGCSLNPQIPALVVFTQNINVFDFLYFIIIKP